MSHRNSDKRQSSFRMQTTNLNTSMSESEGAKSDTKMSGGANGENCSCGLVEEESFVVVCPKKMQDDSLDETQAQTKSCDTSAALRRLSREFAKINKQPIPGFKVKLADDANLFEWEVLMTGPAESPFAGGTFRLRLQFPNDYNTSPPKVYFYSEMFHPNVFAEDGRVCVDILQNAEKWQPQYGVETVLMALQILLAEPNPLSPANVEAGDLYQTDLEEYYRRAKRIVRSSESYRKRSIDEEKINFNTIQKSNQLCAIM